MLFEPIHNPLTIIFVLVFIVTVSIWAEDHVKHLGKLGAAALTILIAMLLSNIGILPGSSGVYDFFTGYGVLAGITLVLLGVDIRSILQAGKPMLLAFGIGAVGSAVGATIMGLLLQGSIGGDTWKLSGQFAATYVGAGVNYAAVRESAGHFQQFVYRRPCC